MPDRGWSNGFAYIAVAGAFALLSFFLMLGSSQESNQRNEAAAHKEAAPQESKQVEPPPVIGFAPPETRPQTYNEQSYADEADLIAQRWMAWAAAALLIVTTLGVLLVGITVWQTRGVLAEAKNATTAANDTVKITREIAYGQLRPYVGLQGIECVMSPGGFQLQPRWKNFGQTPTVNALCMLGWAELPQEPDATFAYPDKLKDPTRLELPPGHHIPIFGPNIPNLELDRLSRNKIKLYVWGWIEYGDNMSPHARHRTEFCQAFAIKGARDSWQIMGVGPHNGADTECLKKPHTK